MYSLISVLNAIGKEVSKQNIDDNPDMNFDYTVSTGPGQNLDYCQKEVRDYYGSYIIELCKNYDIDFKRISRFTGYELCEKCR